MFDLFINEEDRAWLSANYQSLKIQDNKNGITEVVGTLNFRMTFLEEGKYIINPDQSFIDGVKIEDSYEIRIELKPSEISNLPQVYETGSRIKTVARKENLKLEDLHINPKGETACLCIKPEESENLPNGFNLKDFFNNLVIPFFYAQSYFETQKSWPWGDYGHGIDGLIEWYNKQRDFKGIKADDFLKMIQKYKDWALYEVKLKDKRGIKGHHDCICGSKKKFRDCHKKVFEGMWQLRINLKK